MELRYYQRGAIDATWKFMRERDGNPCIVLPTGAGKTIVLAEIIRESLTSWPGTRIAVLAHVKELVEQNADKLRRHWPDAPLGIYSAGLGRRDRFEPIIFAGIQSVAKRAQTLGRFDLLLIDEAHRVPLKSEGLYRHFIDDCRRANPTLRIAGLTATPYRLGGGPVCGPDFILNDIAYEAPIRDLMKAGYLCRLVSKAGLARADLSGVHIRNGEYNAGELEAACNQASVVEAACDEIATLCADRKAWLVFCAGVGHAEAVRATLAARGVSCATILGDTPAGERAASLAAFQRGDIRALVNVNVLSEGFDATHVDAVILLRPTKSAALYYQQCGRGLRLHPGKENCLVLDFAGNIIEHGPIDAIKPPGAPGDRAKSDAIMRSCPGCQSILAVQIRTCPDCGYVFPFDEKARHDATASDAAILSDEIVPPKEYSVTSVRYTKHEKPGKPPSLRVIYQCGLRSFSEWVLLEHGGIARARAMSWWMTRDADGLTPRRVDDAMQCLDRLRSPSRIRVLERGKFPEVTDYDFDHAN